MSPTDPQASGRGTTPQSRPAQPAAGRPAPSPAGGAAPSAANGAPNATANGAAKTAKGQGGRPAPAPARPAPVRPAPAAGTQPMAPVAAGTRPAQAPATRPAAQPAPRPEAAAAARATGPATGSVAARPGTPRKVRLNVARLDPWSVLKLSFLLSVGLGIATVVATFVVWTVLNGMGVFTDINRIVRDILGATAAGNFDLYTYIGRNRVLSLATVIAVANVVLLTALSTLGAFLYNLASGLVGGLHVTLSDD